MSGEAILTFWSAALSAANSGINIQFTPIRVALLTLRCSSTLFLTTVYLDFWAEAPVACLRGFPRSYQVRVASYVALIMIQNPEVVRASVYLYESAGSP